MEVSAAIVKQLRDRTGAGMMCCCVKKVWQSPKSERARLLLRG